MSTVLTFLEVVAGFIVLLVVIVLVAWVWRILYGRWLLSRLRRTWPSGTVALVAYTNNRKWAPYVEERILPKIAACSIVIDRSQAQWKERFPLEEKAIRHWGGWREYNPLVIAFIPGRKPQVFKLYEAFQETRRGRYEDLESRTNALLTELESYSARAA